MGYVKIFDSILRSSIWVIESKETRLVWITMLALASREGLVTSSVVGLADAAKVSLEECNEALRVLLEPDPNDSSGVDSGRRLRVVQGGWEIVNFKTYRMKLSQEERREYMRQKQAEYRARQRVSA